MRRSMTVPRKCANSPRRTPDPPALVPGRVLRESWPGIQGAHHVRPTQLRAYQRGRPARGLSHREGRYSHPAQGWAGRCAVGDESDPYPGHELRHPARVPRVADADADEVASRSTAPARRQRFRAVAEGTPSRHNRSLPSPQLLRRMARCLSAVRCTCRGTMCDRDEARRAAPDAASKVRTILRNIVSLTPI